VVEGGGAEKQGARFVGCEGCVSGGWFRRCLVVEPGTHGLILEICGGFRDGAAVEIRARTEIGMEITKTFLTG
jgi:hypothetical protein